MNYLFKRFIQRSLSFALVLSLFFGISGTTESAFAASHQSSPTLYPGSEGAAVEALQTQLQQRGYFDEAITGIFDSDTQTAVETFQRDKGIEADGIVGLDTQQQLLGVNTDRASMPPDIQRILDKGELIVAVLGNNNPPFFMGTQRDPEGLDIKIAQGLADALGVDLVFNRSADTFNGVVDQVYQLKADIAISKLSRTLSRGQRVAFSRPYVNMRQGLLVNRVQIARQAAGRSTIEAIREFSGTVGVIEGSSYAGFLKQKFPEATIHEYPTWDDIVEAVVAGDVQAAYRDELEVKKVILKNPDAALNLQTIALTDTRDRIAMAMPWDSTQLQAFVNQYLDNNNIDYDADNVLEEYADSLRAETDNT